MKGLKGNMAVTPGDLSVGQDPHPAICASLHASTFDMHFFRWGSLYLPYWKPWLQLPALHPATLTPACSRSPLPRPGSAHTEQPAPLHPPSMATRGLLTGAYTLSRPSSSGVEIPSSFKVGLSSWMT